MYHHHGEEGCVHLRKCPAQCVLFLVSCCEPYVLRMRQAVFVLQFWPSFIASLGGVVVKLIVTSASCPDYVKK